jgi:hypothetical protein
MRRRIQFRLAASWRIMLGLVFYNPLIRTALTRALS